MKLKKESPAGKQGRSGEHDKGNNSSRIRTTVKALFSSGKKLTAVQINEMTQSNDARKVISDLRRDGWNITDLRLSDNRKLYWLATDMRQFEIFNTEEANL